MYSMLSYLVTQVSYGSLLLKLRRKDNKPPLLNCYQPSNGSFGRAKISSSVDNHQGPCYAEDLRDYMNNAAWTISWAFREHTSSLTSEMVIIIQHRFYFF